MASAAILSGGAARRFGGTDKGALRVAGRTILDRQLAALTPVSDDIMLVGHPAPAHDPRLRIVADRSPGLGPLAGLEAALEAAREPVLILLACDLPFVTTDLLTYLVSLADGVDAVVPRDDRGYHPLCAVYDRRCLDVVRRRLQARTLALTHLFTDVRVRPVPVDDLARFGAPRRLLANVNTPADRDDAETLLEHEP